jgi:hypothetical protein
VSRGGEPIAGHRPTNSQLQTCLEMLDLACGFVVTNLRVTRVLISSKKLSRSPRAARSTRQGRRPRGLIRFRKTARLERCDGEASVRLLA